PHETTSINRARAPKEAPLRPKSRKTSRVDNRIISRASFRLGQDGDLVRRPATRSRRRGPQPPPRLGHFFLVTTGSARAAPLPSPLPLLGVPTRLSRRFVRLALSSK